MHCCGEMKIFTKKFILLLSFLMIYSGHSIQALSSYYNYSATRKYWRDPLTGPYEGRIIVNPNFNHSANGWTVLGQGVNQEERISDDYGKSLTVVRSRKLSLNSFSQGFQLNEENTYASSVLFQVIAGNNTLRVYIGRRHGAVIDQRERWFKPLFKLGVKLFGSPVAIFFEAEIKHVTWKVTRLTFLTLSVEYGLGFDEEWSLFSNFNVSLCLYYKK